MPVSMRKGVQMGYGQRVLSPKNIANLAAWYDVSNSGFLLKSNGSRVGATGDTVALIMDKSGNSSTNCLCLNGVAGNYASTPDAAWFPTTAIDVRARMMMVDWTAVGNSTILSKFSTAGQRSIIWRMTPGGTFELVVSQDGTNSTFTVNSTTAPTVSDLATIWVRFTWSSAGTAKFYQAADNSSMPSTWTQVGADVAAVATTIFDGTDTTTIGARGNTGTSDILNGNIYRLQIRNNILDDGTGIQFDANFATAAKLTTSFTENSSNAATVTINTSGDLGARISGERDLVQLTASKQPIYLPWSGTNYGYLNGVAGNSFSTPDIAAQNISTAGEIIAKLYSASYAGMNGCCVSKNGASGTSGYALRFTSGLPVFTYGDGTQYADFSTANLTTILSSGDVWVKVTWTGDNGAGGRDTKFWYSLDGSSYTQLGSTVTTAGTKTLTASTQSFYVGRQNSGPGGQLNANVYYASVATSIGGTPATIFNPSRYTSGTTFTASMGETWTLNGGATIVTRSSLYFDGSDDYMKAAAFSLSQPETVYFTGQQVSWTANDRIFAGDSDSVTQLEQITSSPSVFLRSSSGTNDTNSWTINTKAIILAIYNGVSSFLRVNRLSAIGPSTNNTVGNGFTLGTNGGATANFANISTNEILIYSAAHSTTTQNLILAYLGAKWKILLS